MAAAYPDRGKTRPRERRPSNGFVSLRKVARGNNGTYQNGTPLTLTVTVGPADGSGPTPTGTINLYHLDYSYLGNLTLSGGIATHSLTSLSAPPLSCSACFETRSGFHPADS